MTKAARTAMAAAFGAGRRSWCLGASAALLLLLAVPAQAAGLVGVSGATLTRDGRPWVPRGLDIYGFVTPGEATYPLAHDAALHWGQAELDHAHAFGADTIRFEVSQWGLDPQSTAYVPAYLGRVTQAVALARRDGFSVIVAMQTHGTPGIPNTHDLPEDATTRAWAALTPALRGDAGVMLELFNEPTIRFDTPPKGDAMAAIWSVWRARFLPLVQHLRAAGVGNVLILDGPQTANFLGEPAVLPDPHLAYAVHPYFGGVNGDPGKWPLTFGNLAARVPVIATEWDLDPKVGCIANGPALAQRFIAYLQAHRIGLVGWGFDVPGALIRDYSYAPTTYSPAFHCGAGGQGGPGQLLSVAFHAPE
jgi:hypothetical protein